MSCLNNSAEEFFPSLRNECVSAECHSAEFGSAFKEFMREKCLFFCGFCMVFTW